MSSAAKPMPSTSDIQNLVGLVRTYAGSVVAQATTTQAAAAPAGTADASGTLSIIESILSSVTAFASMFFPGAQLFGMGVTQILALISGLANQVPEVVAAIQSLEAAFSNGQAPTPDQWAALDAAADLAHQNLQAAATAFLAKQGPKEPAQAPDATKPAPAASVAAKSGK